MPPSVNGLAPWASEASASSAIAPALPPLKADFVDSVPPAETSSRLCDSSVTVGPCSVIVPPLAVDSGASGVIAVEPGSCTADGQADGAPPIALLIQVPLVSMEAPWIRVMPLSAILDVAVPAVTMVVAVTLPDGTTIWPSMSTWLARSVSVPPIGPAIVTFSGTVTRPLALIVTESNPVVT